MNGSGGARLTSVVAAVAVVAGVAGCTAPAPALPVLEAVSPDRGTPDRPVELTITGSNLAPRLFTDFTASRRSALDDTWTARLGREALADVHLGDDGAVHATVPAGFEPGLYDVTVGTPWGTSLTLSQAYRELSLDTVASLVASFRVAPVGPQRARVPFTVAIEALDTQGVVLEGFNGTASLADLTLTAVPLELGHFARGRWTGAVEVRVPHAADALAVLDADGHRGASNPFAVTTGPAVGLRFTTPPRVVAAGACSPAVTVEQVDSTGLQVAAVAAFDLDVTATPAVGLGLSTDASCGAALGVARFAAGQGATTLYFQGSRAGVVTLRVLAPGLSGAVQDESVGPGPAAALAFTSPPLTVNVGTCSPTVTLEVRDAFANPVVVAMPTALALAAAPSAGFTFHGAPGCGAAATQVTVAAGQTQAQLAFTSTTLGAVTMTATSPGLSAASQVAQISPQGSATRLAITSAAQSLPIAQCSGPLTIQTQDSTGAAVVDLRGLSADLDALPAAGLSFFSDAACATPAASVPFAAGSSTTTAWFKGLVPGAVAARVRNAVLAGDQQTQTLLPGPPAALAVVTPPQSMAAGACSGEVIVQVQDATGFATTAPAGATVALASTPVAGLALYADAACTAAASSVPIAPGAGVTRLWFRGTAAGPVTLQVSATGLTPSQQVETITAGPPARLAFVTAAQSLAAGACSALATLEAQDAFGNPSPVAAATTVTLAAAPAPGFTFHGTATCGAGAITSVAVAASATRVSLYFRVTQAGAVGVTASATGLTAATQTETVQPGVAASFQWNPVTSPIGLTAPLLAGLRALDPFGNLATGFSGTAVVSIAPAAAAVACATACTSATTTGPFAAGVWNGTLTLGGAAGAGRVLTATQGPLTGASNAFTTISIPTRSGPVARFTASPRSVLVGQPVTFDASASTDWQTPPALLQVSWDFDGTSPAAPPWTAWTAAKTVTHAFPAAGVFATRLAVRDADGDLGFTVGWVQVLPAATTSRCVVTTANTVDDGATTCAGASGPDGVLSLAEAVRLSNSLAGTQTITFSGPMTITSNNNMTFTASADVVAPPGVLLSGPVPRVGTAGILVRLYGLELANQTALITVSGGGSLQLYDCWLHNFRGISNRATLHLEGVTVEACTATACLDTSGATTIRSSQFRNANTGIELNACVGGTGVDVVGTVFSGLSQGINANCPSAMLLRNNTFDGNGIGIDFNSPGGTGHVLTNNLFTNHTTVALQDCPNATFTQRARHLLFGNAANEGSGGGGTGACCCNVGADAAVLTVNPLYAVPGSSDYGLSFGSPAIDTALDLGLTLTHGGPGNFLGAGPDRGGRESY